MFVYIHTKICMEAVLLRLELTELKQLTRVTAEPSELLEALTRLEGAEKSPEALTCVLLRLFNEYLHIYLLTIV